jgi:PilZ domain
MPLADRRLVSRHESAGNRLGMLDALEPLRVRNLSSDGMLIEYPNALAVGSIHEFQLIEGTTSVRVRAAVRHVSRLPQSSAEGYFLVGLEFLTLNARSSAVIERWINAQSAQPASRGA